MQTAPMDFGCFLVLKTVPDFLRILLRAYAIDSSDCVGPPARRWRFRNLNKGFFGPLNKGFLAKICSFPFFFEEKHDFQAHFSDLAALRGSINLIDLFRTHANSISVILCEEPSHCDTV